MLKNSGLRWLSIAAATLTLAIVAGCPSETETAEDDGGPSSTTTDGSGGMGGFGGFGGFGGDPLPCGIDCSQIDAGQCKVSQCNLTTLACEIINDVDGGVCDDDQFCTINDTCQAGNCVGGPPNDCGMSAGECLQIACNEDTDTCNVIAADEGMTCQQPDLCIVGSTCVGGNCVGGAQNDCFFQPVPNDCHVSVCNPANGMCEPIPGNEGQSCVDISDLCIINQTCTNGVCGNGVPVDCSYLTQGCDLGVCDSTTGMCGVQAVPNGQMCDDLSACTVGELCTNGTCGGGTPVTVCEMVGDGCCPTSCNEFNDIDCTVQPSCLAIKTSVPASTSGIYVVDPDLSGPIQQTNVFCDMDQDQGGWTLIARFANQDAANWMLDTGEWWYTRMQEAGMTTNRADNADMISRAFWTVQGTELKFSRTDNPNDAALFRTNAGCVPSTDFRTFITSFGNFQNGAVWGNNSVAGTCPGIFGNNYATTNGFQQATCNGDIGSPNSISFWADWSAGDGSVIMIGGGGNACQRADHGIGVTEANAASFVFSATSEDDFGSNGSDSLSNDPYAINLFIR